MSASRQKKLRKEQSDAVAQETKRRVTEEEKAAKRLKIWSVVFYIVIGAMVLGLLVSAVWNSGLLPRMVTALTVGNHKISAAEMNYFFADTLNSDQLLPYYGISTNKTLAEQYYNEEEGQTWADYYYTQAIERAKAVYAVYDEAMANNFTLSDESEANIEMAVSNMDTFASHYGYNNGDAMLRAQYGKGCNMKNYEAYMKVVQLATDYMAEYQANLTATEQEIMDEVAANAVNYTSYSYRYMTLSVKDYYEGEADENGSYTEEQTTAALAAAKAAADELLAQVNGKPETFAGQEDSILKEDSSIATMVAVMKDWMSAEERTENEAAVLEMENQGGYYVIMFLGSNDNTNVFPVNVRHILLDGGLEPEGKNETGTAIYTAEQLATIREEAQAMLDEWAEGDATEDSFAALANSKSTDPGSNTNGGLYENVIPGQMVETFNDWIFDESRQPGDTGLVETEYGVHIMYFVGTNEMNFRDYQAQQVILNNKYETWYNGLVEAITAKDGMGKGLVTTDVTIKNNTTIN